jgi:hypothetical protein
MILPSVFNAVSPFIEHYYRLLEWHKVTAITGAINIAYRRKNNFLGQKMSKLKIRGGLLYLTWNEMT